MAFQLVKAEKFDEMADKIRKSTGTTKELISKFLLSHLHHFHVNGKKVPVLQGAIDVLLETRYRDYDVIEITLRALTPIEFDREVKGRKKWINIIGEKQAKDQGDPKKVKAAKDANNAKWANSFERFAKGEEIEVGNPEYYRGVNDGLKETDAGFVKEKLSEQFNQDIFELVDRLKDIQTLRAELAAQRAGAPSDSVNALSLNIGNVQRPFNNSMKKLNAALDAVTTEYIENATVSELDALDGYADELEKEADALIQKLDKMRAELARVKEEAAEKARRQAEEETLAAAAAILERRSHESEGVEETSNETATQSE